VTRNTIVNLRLLRFFAPCVHKIILSLQLHAGLVNRRQHAGLLMTTNHYIPSHFMLCFSTGQIPHTWEVSHHLQPLVGSKGGVE
jgi:hypothetical protein